MFVYQSVYTESVAGNRLLRREDPEDEWIEDNSDLADSVQTCAKQYLEKTRKQKNIPDSAPCPVSAIIIVRYELGGSDEDLELCLLKKGKPVAFLPQGTYKSLEEVMKALIKWAFMVSYA